MASLRESFWPSMQHSENPRWEPGLLAALMFNSLPVTVLAQGGFLCLCAVFDIQGASSLSLCALEQWLPHLSPWAQMGGASSEHM